MRGIFAVLALGPILLAAACASNGDFPSLAPRAVEKLTDPSLVEAEASPPEAAPADAALLERIAELRVQAETGNEAFTARLEGVRASVRRAGRSGSDSWIAAQQELSALVATRGPTLDALSALERLPLERTDAGLTNNEADLEALRIAAEAVRAIADAQQRTVSELESALSPL